MENSESYSTQEFEVIPGQSYEIPTYSFKHLSFSTTVSQVGVDISLSDPDGNVLSTCSKCKKEGYSYCCSLSEMQVTRKDVKSGRVTKATFIPKGKVTVLCAGLEDHSKKVVVKLNIKMGIIEDK